MDNPLNSMKSSLSYCLIVALGLFFCPIRGATQETTVETLVCFRHAEKPPEGLGQLTCQGLNRSLALPKVLLSKYGKPQFIFAPNPSQKVHDKGGEFYYVRPLVTVEPTAIKCGLPVQLPFGYKEIEDLQDELLRPKYQSSMVFVSWEHLNLDKFAKNLMTTLGGDRTLISKWPDDDYDRIYVFKITRHNGHAEISFRQDQEHLNHLSTAYP